MRRGSWVEGMGLLLCSVIYLVYSGVKRKSVWIMQYFDAKKSYLFRKITAGTEENTGWNSNQRHTSYGAETLTTTTRISRQWISVWRFFFLFFFFFFPTGSMHTVRVQLKNVACTVVHSIEGGAGFLLLGRHSLYAAVFSRTIGLRPCRHYRQTWREIWNYTRNWA